MKELARSKKFKIAAGIIGSFILALVIFGAGMSVGIRKARFSYQFSENYERNFMESRPNGPMRGPVKFFRDMEGKGFRNAHGLAGTIISITDNNLVVKDRDNKENTVAITEKTIIKKRRDDLKITDLELNDQIVIMGTPDTNGIINATLIRVFDNDGQK